METTLHTNVVVMGAGAAGVAAAVAAAEQGLQVCIIEKNSYLGGKATAAEVGTICGLYTFSKSSKSEFIVKGFAKEFVDRLQKTATHQSMNSAEGLHYLPYDIEVFKNICEDILNEKGVAIYYNSIAETIYTCDDIINGVRIICNENTININCDAVIDCSGESIVSTLANLPVLKSQQYQAAAQVFSLQGVLETNEVTLGFVLMKALRNAIDNNQLDVFYDRVYVVQGSLKNNSVSLKLGIPIEVTYEPDNLDIIKESAHTFIHTLVAFLTTHIPAFKNASLQHIADEVGIRVGLRTVGKYILTEEDVLGCKKFDDAIANCSWPIEEWAQDKRVKMRYLKIDDFYQIPIGCLQSNSVKNLFIGGRNISATNAAIASARVIGVCLQTGYAAGMLASSHISGLCEEKIIRNIQSRQV
jgi:FAD dependent oxidoreductase